MDSGIRFLLNRFKEASFIEVRVFPILFFLPSDKVFDNKPTISGETYALFITLCSFYVIGYRLLTAS